MFLTGDYEGFNINPVPRSENRQLGFYGELVAAGILARLGFIVSSPLVDARYDLITDWNGKVNRIQVKATARKDLSNGGERYKLMTQCGRVARKYIIGDFDFLLGYIMNEETWYVFPCSIVAGKHSISLFTNICGTKSKYEQYRNNWNLLK